MNSLDVKKEVINYSNVKSITVKEEHLLYIERRFGSPAIILILNEDYTSLNALKLLNKHSTATHLLTSSEQWDSDSETFKYLRENRISIINYKDLFASVQKSDNEYRIQSKLRFIWNKLIDHSKTSEVIQLNSWRILVKRKQMPSVIIGIIDTYDISAYDVSNLLRKYDKIDIIYRSNINSNITTSAIQLAKENGLKILRFRDLYSILNRIL